MTAPLLDIRDLHLTMKSFDGEAHVLNGITLALARGEIWGLVGETGCGKSLTGLSVSRLVSTPPARYPSGEIRLNGQDLLHLPEAGMQKLLGRHIGMIFQDPTTNLNPSFTIGEQLIPASRWSSSGRRGSTATTARTRRRRGRRGRPGRWPCTRSAGP